MDPSWRILGMEETARTSDVSWTTAEASSEEEHPMYITVKGDIKVPVEGDVLARYLASAKNVRAQILWYQKKRNIFPVLDFPPVLVAENVTADILEGLPTLVADMHVKCEVRDGSLFIINLSGGNAHGSGVVCMSAHVFQWAQRTFSTMADTTLKYPDNSGRAPDLVVQVAAEDLPPNGLPRRIIVMELEVSNRSIPDMKKDFIKYFQDESVFCLIVIKIFTGMTDGIVGKRAVAIQWSRPPEGGGPVVEAVRDIGFLPITEQAKALFAADLHDDTLPRVPREMWDANRHAPVPRDHPQLSVGLLREDDFAAAAFRHLRSLRGEGWQTLYGTVHPTFRIDGARACSYIHNLPPGVLPVGDLWLNLADVFYAVVKFGPLPPPPMQVAPLQQQEQEQGESFADPPHHSRFMEGGKMREKMI